MRRKALSSQALSEQSPQKTLGAHRTQEPRQRQLRRGLKQHACPISRQKNLAPGEKTEGCEAVGYTRFVGQPNPLLRGPCADRMRQGIPGGTTLPQYNQVVAERDQQT